MPEKKTQTIVIDDIEHDTTNFTPEQILLTNHCLDLDRKIGSSQFQIQQLQVGKDAFVKMLKDSLEKPKE
jgi:glutamine cyclotransferase